ncbi:DUF2064 domain-containing protein [Flavobacteriaceae bacterium TP-CH-4]|uniref:DUF2064 domain-containing protein n=1 Tax=Pelagihabitans pacificus TaxID=2696054 RepID=A0A967ATF2_9FLAO|nr:DUF2064 domain-containing protein [Pelagihabitans pacificus]NHF59105.1 DUF2064 domain-containing protein [Pelagihabitans pacificus]
MGRPIKDNTLVLVFARSPEEEMRHKAIDQGNLLFDALTQQTLKTIRKTGLSYLHMDESSQKGETFGDRFTNAIKTVFEQGYEQIITLGGDTPQLRVSHILQAKKQLQENKFVLGPATDGGFYLMGVHRSQFNASTFRELPWQTSSVTKALLKLVLKDKVKVFKLPTLFDIDTAADLPQCFRLVKGVSTTVLGIVVFILGIGEHGYHYQFPGALLFNSSVAYNKGSPFSC